MRRHAASIKLKRGLLGESEPMLCSYPGNSLKLSVHWLSHFKKTHLEAMAGRMPEEQEDSRNLVEAPAAMMRGF